MANLHALIVPSRLEAFALASLEAQAVSVPVICFENTGVAEVIKRGETGEAVEWCNTEALAASMTEQIRVLLDAGVDCLILETCQDLLQVKTGVVCAMAVMAETGREVPLMVSVTIEQTGTMLVGSDIATVCTTLEPFPIFSLGLNCATGPEAMKSHMRHLNHHWPRRISCIPNQGLPEVVDGQTVYRMSPEEYGKQMRAFVEEYGISVVGGCCGTTPEHTQALVQALADVPTEDLLNRSVS